jgi:hypothetical protein
MKNKFRIFYIAFVFAFISNALSQTTLKNSIQNKEESLKFLMHYGWIDGGIATLEIRESLYKGQKVLYAKAVGETIGITDKIYNVHDVYESYFDPETYLPYKSIRNILEGKYKAFNEVEYYHHQKYVISSKSGKHFFPDSMPPKVFDIISGFYYARKNSFKNIKEGNILNLHTYFDDEFWLMQVKYFGKKTIKTKLGKIQCMEFRPVVPTGRVFDTKDDVKIWISDDNNNIPIRAQIDLLIGSFKADLIEYSGLTEPLKFIQK